MWEPRSNGRRQIPKKSLICDCHAESVAASPGKWAFSSENRASVPAPHPPPTPSSPRNLLPFPQKGRGADLSLQGEPSCSPKARVPARRRVGAMHSDNKAWLPKYNRGICEEAAREGGKIGPVQAPQGLCTLRLELPGSGSFASESRWDRI